MSAVWCTDHDATPAQSASAHATADRVRVAVRDALLAAPNGLTNGELYDRFGPHAVKRLNDLRHDGFEYTREQESARVFRYRLRRLSYIEQLQREANGGPKAVRQTPRDGEPQPTAPVEAPTTSDDGRDIGLAQQGLF